ncbi:hypothetical protein ACOSQ2_023244 [Xanthoceras sorbifolium]
MGSKCFPPFDYFNISKINHHGLIHDFTNNIYRERGGEKERERERDLYVK